MRVNDIIHGFQIKRVRSEQSLGGTLYEMTHLRTGAELAYLDNGEENKLFSVAFKTLPWDDTGVFHILEHSVLAGSDNFPVKEPFLDLLKSSMNTFLNAMTFPDKTMYPVSSKNEQDFMNLTRVYLDAVFCPAIYHNESIFRQEGWHYEWDENGKPFYNGVVFNEMKGALSSVEGVTERCLMRELYPDSIYGFESGGDPKSIPDLTYENFLRAHREFYSPSNAKIYLDGSVPLDRVLELIDGEYLSVLDFDTTEHTIEMQKPLASREVTDYYEIGAEESENEKTQVVFGNVFADWSERKRIMAYRLLFSYLGDTNESPLCRAILEKGLAQDVVLSVQDGIAQPFYSITFRNTNPDKKDEIKKVYKQTLDNIIANGIDLDELTACLNRLEFSVREKDEPKGLERNIYALSSWLYGGDIMLWLDDDAMLGELREALESDYYLEILKELACFDNTLCLTMLPSKTKGEEDRAAEDKRVNAEYGSFSEDERKRVKELYDNMRTWQDTPDSPEAKATLPVLSLSDVSETPEYLSTEVIGKNGYTAISHTLSTDGIVYVNLYFNIADKTPEELQKLSVTASLLGLLPTSKHTAAQLQKEIKKNIGAINFSIETLPVIGSPDKARVYFAACIGVLENNLSAALSLVREILRDTDFSAKAVIKENLLQRSEELYQSVMGAGHQFAFRRALSHSSAVFAVREACEGYEFLRNLKAFNEDFDNRIAPFCEFSAAQTEDIFVKERLVISETSPEFHAETGVFADALPSGKCSLESLTLTPENEPVKEAVLIPAGVSYAAFASNIERYGYSYRGRLTVVSLLLTYGYLWNEIRVHGGAYGCGFRASIGGNISFHSYRDPNPLNSLEVYKNTARFIEDYSEGSIDKYIISSIAQLDGLLSNAKKGMSADSDYLIGLGYDDALSRRRDMLSFTEKELRELVPLFEKMAAGNSTCVIGNADALSDLPDDWRIYRL